MYHAQEHRSGLGIFFLNIVFDNIRKGAIASLVALYDLPAFFIHYNNMVVFVNDFHTSYIFIPPST